MNDRAALRLLARGWGVQTSYRDVWGRRREADPDVLAAVLRSLGAPVTGAGDASAALRDLGERRLARVVEPACVAWDGSPVTLDLSLPAAFAGTPIDFELEILPAEPGGGIETRLLRRRPRPVARPARGRGPFPEAVPCRVTLPGRLPPGCHTLRFRAAGRNCESRILSAPRTAPGLGPDRPWGVFLPLYSVRSASNWGAGDFTDLARLARWTSESGGSLLGVLPLLASFLDEPCEPSPYMPASRLFLNEIFVDVTAIPELAACEGARRLLGSGEILSGVRSLRASHRVKYRPLMALKRRVLMELGRCPPGRTPGLAAALRRFAAERPEALDYARFRAMGEKTRTPWQAWTGPPKDGTIREEEVDPEVERYHLTAQCLAEEQLAAASAAARAAGVRLYLDFPLGVHPSGYDAWRERDLFLEGIAVGAPPDFAWGGGQNWGFPPMNPDRLRRQGYRYLRASLRQSLRHAGVLRVDHVMGFHRLFVIPNGAPAEKGVYLRYPSEENYAVLCLEARQSGCAVIGEDLGTVPAAVRASMREHALNRMYVAQREILLRPDRPLAGIPAGALACLNTHDMPTFTGFWNGAGPRIRRELGLADERRFRLENRRLKAALRRLLEDLRRRGCLDGDGEGGDTVPRVLSACLHRLAASRAGVLLVNLEDLWGEDRPQNVPGTWKEKPNWRRKARMGLEAILRDPELAAALAGVNEARQHRRRQFPGRGAR